MVPQLELLRLQMWEQPLKTALTMVARTEAQQTVVLQQEVGRQEVGQQEA